VFFASGGTGALTPLTTILQTFLAEVLLNSVIYTVIYLLLLKITYYLCTTDYDAAEQEATRSLSLKQDSGRFFHIPRDCALLPLNCSSELCRTAAGDWLLVTSRKLTTPSATNDSCTSQQLLLKYTA